VGGGGRCGKLVSKARRTNLTNGRKMVLLEKHIAEMRRSRVSDHASRITESSD
jgi:hypothetical protein